MSAEKPLGDRVSAFKRLRDYVWVKNTLSLIEHEGGERKIYSVYNDMTKEREERARVRQQYNDLLCSIIRGLIPTS